MDAKTHQVDERRILMLKCEVWVRIEEERWRRVRIEYRAAAAGKRHYFERVASERLDLSKKDERFLKSLRIRA